MARSLPLEALIESYARLGHTALVALEVGNQRASVEQRFKKEGVRRRDDFRRVFRAREDARIRAEFPEARADGPAAVAMLAQQMGRSAGAVIDRAFRIGVEFDDGTHLLRDGGRVGGEASMIAGVSIGWLVGRHGATGLVIEVPGAPVPWPRAGTRPDGGHYVPKAATAARDVLAARFATLPTLRGNVALGLFFALGSRRRIDVDNLEKLVLDAGNDGGLWLDDAQVTAKATGMTLDTENPRTVISVMQYVDQAIPRGTDHWPRCAVCCEPFNPGTRKRPPQTCSIECTAELAEAQLTLGAG
jgi:Holliday junction resolvase RusA-like endonuclease